MSTTTRLNNGLTSHSTQLTSSSTTTSKQPQSISTTNKEHIEPLYTQWKGNNTICCKGRIIGGPQKQNFFYTLLLIIFPSIFFISFVSMNYIHEHNNYYVLIIYIILLLISLIAFALTAFTDPGIIPRGILPMDSNYKGPIHLKQRMCISGKLIEIKWCGTCHIFRPPRSFHCYICNNCVERFDHHCPWIGNCIGIRNYAYFTIFVNSLQLLCFWALFYCIYILYLRTNDGNIKDKSTWKQFKYSLKYEYMAFGTGIYIFIGMWFVIGLTWFHWFLVFVGKTTNEQLRNLHPAGSPFKRSLMGNIIDHCCQFPPTSVHLHHTTPKASYNELYVDKSKVILLDNNGVQKHHQQIHSMHINSNSPFKACLINNFGYTPNIMQKNNIIPCMNINGIDNNTLINKNNNGRSPVFNDTYERSPAFKFIEPHKNGKNKNGYVANIVDINESHIQMTHFSNNRPGKNGYHRGQTTNNNSTETDGKIEEEAQIIIHNNDHDIEEKNNEIIMDINMGNSMDKNAQNEQDEKDIKDVMEDEEQEENKYDEDTNNGIHNGMDDISKSKSRKDENIDQENLYISYDDESDADDGKLHQPQYQYSRSVTPDINTINNSDINNSDINNSDINNSDINNSDINNSDINKSSTPIPNNTLTIRKNNRTLSNASKVSIPSESPGSDNW